MIVLGTGLSKVHIINILGDVAVLIEKVNHLEK